MSFRTLAHRNTRTAKRTSKPFSAVQRRLSLDVLEPRLMLYGVNGGIWPHPEFVTVSFMPEGTDLGGVPNNLLSTLNSRWPTGTWQKEVLRGVQSFAANSNLNFGLVSDDGSPFGSCGGSGTDCNLQGDSNFGDIRVGGLALGGSLGLAMLPPPLNGDTTAGDFFLDTNTVWNIGTSYDLYTVAAHEAGHSVGLDHSTVTSAVMYSTYTSTKSNLAADDISGIQSIYSARAQDSFDAAGSNDAKANATVITSYIDSNKQVSLPNLDVTTTSDVDWYKIVTPSGTSGSMVVKVQATGLSLLAPKMTVYRGSTLKGTATGDYHSTISISNSIGSGQTWYVKVEAGESTVFGVGRYALQINMGTAAQPPVSSPNTATPVTGSGGNGSPLDAVHDHDHDHDFDGHGMVDHDEHDHDHDHDDLATVVDTTSVSETTEFNAAVRDELAVDEIDHVLALEIPNAGPVMAWPSYDDDKSVQAIDELLSDNLLDDVLTSVA